MGMPVETNYGEYANTPVVETPKEEVKKEDNIEVVKTKSVEEEEVKE